MKIAYILLIFGVLAGAFYGGYRFGEHTVRARSFGFAENELRGLYARIETAQLGDEGEKVYVWSMDMPLPIGVVPLYQQNDQGIIPLKSKRPLLYAKPNFAKDEVIVLFSDGERRAITTTELSEYITELRSVSLHQPVGSKFSISTN